MEEPKTKIQLLKEEAKELGISHSGNIGIEALQNKIRMHKTGESKEATKEVSIGLTENQLRELKIKEATRLRRVIVHCMDNSKTEVRQGEYVMAGNSYVPTIKKYFPYSVVTHLEQILVNVLKEKKFQQRFGKDNREYREVPEFNIVELEDLSIEEAAELKKVQALRKEAADANI